MDKHLEIIRAKALRGEIIEELYACYGDDIKLSELKNIIRSSHKDRPEKDIKRAIRYLTGRQRDFIHINLDRDDYWNSTVSLTPHGVNLAEGDHKDMGVLMNA